MLPSKPEKSSLKGSEIEILVSKPKYVEYKTLHYLKTGLIILDKGKFFDMM